MSPPWTSDPNARVNAPLLDLVHDAVGRGVRVEDVSRDVGRLSIVWRLTGANGVHYLKRHEERNLFDREDRAYARCIPRLRAVPAVHLPQVVARSDTLGALVLTSLPRATPVPDLADGPEQEAAFRNAGRFLRALHDLPLDGEVPDPVEHMRALIEKYVRRWVDVIDPATFDWIETRLDDGRPFAGTRFVCAHRDFSPRNWVVTADGTLGVFDWERAQEDVWLADVTRMEFDVWHEQPALREVFFAGYGRVLTAHDRRRIQLAALIHAVASIAWAARRGDAHFEALARGTIERIRARM